MFRDALVLVAAIVVSLGSKTAAGHVTDFGGKFEFEINWCGFSSGWHHRGRLGSDGEATGKRFRWEPQGGDTSFSVVGCAEVSCHRLQITRVNL